MTRYISIFTSFNSGIRNRQRLLSIVDKCYHKITFLRWTNKLSQFMSVRLNNNLHVCNIPYTIRITRSCLIVVVIFMHFVRFVHCEQMFDWRVCFMNFVHFTCVIFICLNIYLS
jgi:hypothetical protein